MFISVEHFEQSMGVHKAIGRFFVDRKPPEKNSFWKGKLLYIGLGNGYVAIPVYYDILYRIGLPMETLLDENHIQFMEQLMHFAILQEKNAITIEDELKEIRALLNGRVQDAAYYETISCYLNQPVLKPLGPFGLPYTSLNRADAFLYILCDLPLNKNQWEQAIRYWYVLHPTYLIIDDIRDYAKDKEGGEENLILDLGDGSSGFEKTFEMFRKNCEILGELNPALAAFLMSYEEDLRELVPANI